MTAGRRTWEMPISEGQLTSLTRELDEAHRESIPQMNARALDLAEELRDTPSAGRRRFLLGAGGAAMALGLAACSSDKTASTASNGSASATAAATGNSMYTGDL
ncbi:MAG: hypothetical protein ABIS86_11155, partial [Streptosporangiaceae bacterium]